jgi:hypothetical protein
MNSGAYVKTDEVRKVAHYYFSVDVMTQPMKVMEDSESYGGSKQ